MKVLGISGTLVGSKTAVLVNDLLEQLKRQRSDYEIELLNLKDFQLEFCDGRRPEQYGEDIQEIIRKCEDADAFLIGTTILHGSMPGVLKNLFDLVPVTAFSGKVAAFAANGGNELHYLAIENYVKPIASYLKMFTLPEYIFALSSDFDETNHLTEKKREEANEFIKRYAWLLQAVENTKEQVGKA